MMIIMIMIMCICYASYVLKRVYNWVICSIIMNSIIIYWNFVNMCPRNLLEIYLDL